MRHEISLLIYLGRLDGLVGIPSIFEFHGTSADELPAKGRSLKILCVETLAADILWVRYAVDRLPAPQPLVFMHNARHGLALLAGRDFDQRRCALKNSAIRSKGILSG